MTCWWHCSRHRSITAHSVIIQLSVASTQLVSLTPKPPCLRSWDRAVGRTEQLSLSTAWRRLTTRIKSSRLIVVRQPITFRFSSDNRSSRVAFTVVEPGSDSGRTTALLMLRYPDKMPLTLQPRLSLLTFVIQQKQRNKRSLFHWLS